MVATVRSILGIAEEEGTFAKAINFISNEQNFEIANAAVFLGGIVLSQQIIAYFCKPIFPKIKDTYFEPKKILSYSVSIFVVANLMEVYRLTPPFPAPIHQIGNFGVVAFGICAVDKLFLAYNNKQTPDSPTDNSTILNSLLGSEIY